MESEQQFIDRLRASGERVTAPRVALFRALARQAPLSMGSLIAAGRTDGIDQVTVYRTLALFRRLGLVDEVGLGKHRLFEPTGQFGSHHHHATCTACGKVIDFDNVTIEDGIKAATQLLSFEVKSHQLEVVGRCQDCHMKAKF